MSSLKPSVLQERLGDLERRLNALTTHVNALQRRWPFAPRTSMERRSWRAWLWRGRGHIGSWGNRGGPIRANRRVDRHGIRSARQIRDRA